MLKQQTCLQHHWNWVTKQLTHQAADSFQTDTAVAGATFGTKKTEREISRSVFLVDNANSNRSRVVRRSRTAWVAIGWRCQLNIVFLAQFFLVDNANSNRSRVVRRSRTAWVAIGRRCQLDLYFLARFFLFDNVWCKRQGRRCRFAPTPLFEISQLLFLHQP